MKRAIAVALALGLLGGALVAPAEAAKRKKKKPPAPVKVERVVEFDYQCPCVGLFQLGGLTGGTNIGGGPFLLEAGEVYLTAVAEDAGGQPVAVDINQDLDGDGGNNSVGSFCGETAEPMPINEGLEIRVFVGDPTICPGPAFSGTITFTLSNLP
ncbi:MAG TPA: hypothetical protein VJ927_10930 [Actinomycetota bacterium]|nr:hypothetical protein [Actinomycetota bacterium]